MTTVIKLGLLELNMGNKSDCIGIENTPSGYEKYMKYMTYQSKFLGGE